MSKLIKVSDEVYDALQILKSVPSISYNDIVKGLIDEVFPGTFFETDHIDRELFRESVTRGGMSTKELRQLMKMKKERSMKQYYGTDEE